MTAGKQARGPRVGQEPQVPLGRSRNLTGGGCQWRRIEKILASVPFGLGNLNLELGRRACLSVLSVLPTFDDKQLDD